MKNIIKSVFVFVALTLASVACVKEQNPYQPAEPATGEQVFFPNTISAQIDLSKDQTSFDIPVLRNTTALEAIDVAVEASGAGVEIFDIPGTVSFKSGEKESKITINYNPAELPTNVFYDVVLKISDASLTTPYGNAILSFSAGVALPWIAFDSGVLSEVWWGETEEKTLYYQELSATLWLCKLPECWGHNTIAKGEPYDVQDYMFYWDKNTNFLYICYAYMGYTDSDGYDIYIGTKADYYIAHYYNVGQSTLSPCDIGTDEWFAAQDYYLNALYGPTGRPRYDGNGGFYLGDSYLCDQLTMEGYSYQMAGDPDVFICDSFIRKDYSSSVEYGGMFVDPDGNAVPIINFEGTTDVTGLKYVVTGQDVDPNETLEIIVADESEDIQDITLNDGKASVQLDLEVGLYRVVAVPYGEDGALQPGDAVMCDFYFPGANAEKPEVEAELMLLSGTEVFSEAMIQQYGMTDYNSLGYVLYGKEIKAAKYYCNESSVIATWTDPLEDLVAEYGSDFDADDINSINTKGYIAGGFINRKAATEYQMIVVAENAYGSKKTFVAKHTTASLPYQGELVIGEYTIDCSLPDYGTITVTPTEDETKFIVYDIAVLNGAGWNAVYDSAKHTLTCDGTENGYEEEYGNQFGEFYGYWDQARTQVYAIDVYSSDDSDYKEPIVFDVDPETHQLTKIHPNVDLDVFNLSDGSYVGTANSIEDGATVTYVPTNNAVRTVNKASVNKAYRSLKGARFSTVSEFNAETRAFKPLPSSSKEWSTGSMKVKGNSKKNFEVSKVVEKF